MNLNDYPKGLWTEVPLHILRGQESKFLYEMALTAVVLKYQSVNVSAHKKS